MNAISSIVAPQMNIQNFNKSNLTRLFVSLYLFNSVRSEIKWLFDQNIKSFTAEGNSNWSLVIEEGFINEALIRKSYENNTKPDKLIHFTVISMR